MWAEVNGVEMCSQFVEALVNPTMKCLKLRFRVVAACDSRLVRYNYGEIARIVEVPDGFPRTGDPLEVLGLVDEAVIDVEYAIAIQKCGAPLPSRVSRHQIEIAG